MFSDYKIRAGQAMIEKRTLNDTFRCGKCLPEVDNLIRIICPLALLRTNRNLEQTNICATKPCGQHKEF